MYTAIYIHALNKDDNKILMNSIPVSISTTL